MKHYTEDQLDVIYLNLIGIISIPLKQTDENKHERHSEAVSLTAKRNTESR